MRAGCSSWGLSGSAAGASRSGAEAAVQSVEADERGGTGGRSTPRKPASSLHKLAGFRVIDHRERIGRHHRHWRDVVLLERRSPTVT